MTTATFSTLFVTGTISGTGLSGRRSVRAATTVAGTLATSFESGDVIDGVTLATGDRILLKDQASAIENGIYTVNATGAPTRATDLATGDEARSVFLFCEEGTANADKAFLCTDDEGSDVVGTDTLTFVRFDAVGMDIQTTYDNSTSPELVVDATRGALTIRDNATPIGANLFEVQNNGGGTTFFSVDATDVTITGDTTITGNLTVTGTTITATSENVLLADNYIISNDGYILDPAQTGGFAVNYDPTPATQDTVAVGGFTAGVAATSNPTVITTGSATFSASDIIMISSANNTDNNGLFEVLTHIGTTLTIRGVGLTATVEDFTRNQFTTDATVAGTITLTNVTVMRTGTDGVWETGRGAATGITYVDVVDLSATQTLTNKTITASTNSVTARFLGTTGADVDIDSDIPAGSGEALVTTSATVATWQPVTGLVTIQNAYDASTNPELVVDATRGALTIRDNATPIGANLLEVQNNGGGTTFFGVTTAGALADALDSLTATTLLLGAATATKLELADAGVTTEVQGPLTVDNIDTITGTTLLLGPATATKIELADTGVETEVQGTLDVLEAATMQSTLAVDDVDSFTATTLLLGKATATKIELADTGVETEVQGTLDVLEAATMQSTLAVDDVDSFTATTLLLGKATATKVEIADTGVTTEVQGDLTVLGEFENRSLISDTVQTTDATVTTLTTIGTTTDRSIIVSGTVIARRSDAGSETAGYRVHAVFRNNSGTVTQVGTTDKLAFEDTAAWDVTVTISGTDVLLRVTGEVAKTIEWKSSGSYTQSD